MKTFKKYALYRTQLQGGKLVGLIDNCSTQLGPEWPLEPQDTFIAIDPTFRPIPNSMGLALLRIVQSPEFPRNTINVEYIYDIFDTKKKDVYITTWVVPVPHTKPLYLYSGGEIGYGPNDIFSENPVNVIPSFEFKQGWKQLIISPLWVLNEKEFPNGEIKFSNDSLTGRCLPDPKGSMSLDQCISKHTDRPIKDLNITLEKNKNTKHSSPIVLTIIILLIILFLIILLISYLFILPFSNSLMR